ncbi:BRO domain-containing protein [Pseudomonas aeruginosa]|nr:BRO domain-containing protein [Pseudomonas aeruginosa]
MHGHTQLAPHYFFRQQRLLRALLIDDQAWFVLDDFARLIEHSQPEQMLARLDDDQARRESLRSERGEDQAQWLISESGAYAALIYQQRGDGGELRRWLSGEVVPELRSATDDSGMPRYVKLRWERQVVHMLDWQGKLWVNFSEMPDLLERQGEPMVQLGLATLVEQVAPALGAALASCWAGPVSSASLSGAAPSINNRATTRA